MEHEIEQFGKFSIASKFHLVKYVEHNASSDRVSNLFLLVVVVFLPSIQRCWQQYTPVKGQPEASLQRPRRPRRTRLCEGFLIQPHRSHEASITSLYVFLCTYYYLLSMSLVGKKIGSPFQTDIVLKLYLKMVIKEIYYTKKASSWLKGTGYYMDIYYIRMLVSFQITRIVLSALHKYMYY